MELINKLLQSEGFIKKIGERLQKIDGVLISILAKRTEESKNVELWKHLHGDQPILKREIEGQRMAEIATLAGENGMNPDFAKALLYMIICESCRVQIVQHQMRSKEDGKNQEEWFRFLNVNLLSLTKAIASEYDERYKTNAPFATKALQEFEQKTLRAQIETLKGLSLNGLALDLGCATGEVAFQMSPHFKKVVGWDISGDMINVACIKKNRSANFQKYKNVEFEQANMEEKIASLESGSVSSAVMNLGTASDIRKFPIFLKYLKKALHKDGRFLFSFYNAGALIYEFFVPWTVSLAAEIDPIDHCLLVRVNGEAFQIYARPYTVREISNIFGNEKSLAVSSIKTYPTMSSLLPDEFFREEKCKEELKAIDAKLSDMDKGAYIIVTGRKSS